MNKTIGTCSICGGRVSVPMVWLGTVPPIPTCETCGATMKRPHGPVVEMERAKNRGWKPSDPKCGPLYWDETWPITWSD